jgi:hypothetical protein
LTGIGGGFELEWLAVLEWNTQLLKNIFDQYNFCWIALQDCK